MTIEKYAFEVKININSFKNNKYKLFTQKYPDIKVTPLCLNDDKELDILDFVN